jgi:hypothetical membrane protein
MTPPCSGSRTKIAVGAILWIAKLEFFAAEYIAAAAWPGYSLRDDTISLLGTHSCDPLILTSDASAHLCSPLAWLMNGGLVLAGMLTVAGALLTRAWWPATPTATVALGLIVIAGVGTIGVGIWPVDGNEALHVISTLTTFVPGSVGVMLLGATVTPSHRLLGIATILFGAVSLAALALFGAHVSLGLGRGGMERISGYASTLWYVVAGAFILDALRRARQLACARRR